MVEAVDVPPGAASLARSAPIQGERGISPVAGRLGAGRAGRAVTVAALAAGGAVFMAATWTHHGKAKAEDLAPVRQVVAYEGPNGSTARSAGPAPTLAGAASDPNAPTLAASAPPAGLIQAGPQPLPPGSQGQASAGVRGSGASGAAPSDGAPLIAYSANQAAAGADVLPAAASVGRASEGQATELEQLRHGSAIGEARASRLPDRNFLIVAGAALPCVLQTAMDSTTPGYVTCIIPKDVYSDNGAVVLMEKGTRVVGEYRSGMRQGQKRLFVLWDRAVTPQGVAIGLASPAADALGRAGFDGDVESFFWGRFGGALLLSIVNDAVTAAAASNTRYPGVVQAPSEAASIALENSINISPRLRKPQGAEVSIFVAQDLNFAGVYALKAR